MLHSARLAARRVPWTVAAVCSLWACHGPRPVSDADAGPRSPASSPGKQRTASDSDWKGQGATRVEELISGRFAGVRVFNVPGQGFSVRIRGATSVNGSNEPLYIVDGMPYETDTGGLIALNPSDIARIEVLKDAGSIAAYGVRGANGVVVITTKKGR